MHPSSFHHLPHQLRASTTTATKLLFSYLLLVFASLLPFLYNTVLSLVSAFSPSVTLCCVSSITTLFLSFKLNSVAMLFTKLIGLAAAITGVIGSGAGLKQHGHDLMPRQALGMLMTSLRLRHDMANNSFQVLASSQTSFRLRPALSVSTSILLFQR
jgi:hypothetical protein